MSRKLMILTLSAASALILIPASVASAGEWSLDPANEKFPVSFTSVSSGSTTLTTDGSSLKVTCTGSTGSGRMSSSTTAEEVTKHWSGCKENLFGSSCNSTGQPAGSIASTHLSYHTSRIRRSLFNPRGILTTGNSTHYFSTTCGGLVSLAVKGNGLMGELTSPTTCGAVSKSATLKYESPTAGTQKYTQVTEEGTKFDLTSSQNGAAPSTASLEGVETITFAESMTFTC